MRYEIVFKPSAKKELYRLGRTLQTRIMRELERLAANPYHPGTKKLEGDPKARRARVGDYRIVYDVLDQEIVILVLRIAHRREVYRGL